ncbi:hypothetical protein [Kocuria sp.]|uniref:hypothetical protein n=1 Tax=Kocuria sp. TaxID=1871328 RepID=UPI0026DF88B9|nr:hypothetical protein [Kocuria sp.]MDO5619336.1 hypothetical protein [Kocuria sp.]
MIVKIGIRQFLRTWRVWLGITVLAFVSTALIALSVIQLNTARTLSAEDGRAVFSLLYGQVAFVVVAAVIAAGGGSGFAIAATRLDIARLQLVGVTSFQAAAVVIVQVVCAGTFGALLGVLTALPFAQQVFEWTINFTSIDHPVPIAVDVSTLTLVPIAIVFLMVIGAGRVILRVGRTPIVQVMQGAQVDRVALFSLTRIAILIVGGLVCTGLFIGVKGIQVGFGGEIIENDISTVLGLSVLFMLATLCLLSSVSAILIPTVCLAWARLIPARCSFSWHLARSGLMRRDGRSAATILPIAVTIGLPAGLMTIFLTVGGGMGGVSSSAVNVGGLAVLLGPALLVSAVGASMIVFMGGAARKSRIILVRVMGGSRGLVIRTGLAESVVVVVTATAIATILAILVGLVAKMGFDPAMQVDLKVAVVPLVTVASLVWFLVAGINVLPVLLGREPMLADFFKGSE